MRLLPPIACKTIEYFRCSFYLYNHSKQYSSEWSNFEEESRLFKQHLVATLGNLVRCTKFERYISEVYTGILSTGHAVLLQKCITCKKFINDILQSHMCLNVGCLSLAQDYYFMRQHIRLIICNSTGAVIFRESLHESIPSLETLNYILGHGLI